MALKRMFPTKQQKPQGQVGPLKSKRRLRGLQDKHLGFRTTFIKGNTIAARGKSDYYDLYANVYSSEALLSSPSFCKEEARRVRSHTSFGASVSLSKHANISPGIANISHRSAIHSVCRVYTVFTSRDTTAGV